jgi:hypothetical protein
VPMRSRHNQISGASAARIGLMQFVVTFDHNQNTEELEAHGIDQAAWESMFLEYLRAIHAEGGMSPEVTTIASVTLVGQPPTEQAAGLIF